MKLTSGISRRVGSYITAFAVVLAVTGPAHAAGSGMPWEGPLNQILQSITGPVAQVIGVIAITITGLAMAFGDTGGGMKKLLQIVFGLSIAFTATSFFLSFFSFGGGATFGGVLAASL